MQKTKNNWAFFTVAFLILFLFFDQVHPIIPFDTDDYVGMTLTRPGYPTIAHSVLNPAKILPETLQVGTALIASYTIYPLTGDYIAAITAGNACVISLFILLFLGAAQRLIVDRFKVSTLCSYFIIVLFALFHFLFLRYYKQDNDYLWYATNAACFYHYTIPNLLCGSLVCWLMNHKVCTLTRTTSISLFCFVVYLALCSNLFSSVILVAFVGADLLLKLFKMEKSKKGLGIYIKDNLVYLLIIIGWLIVQLFEANGHRAGEITSEQTFLGNLTESIRNLLSCRINLKFLGFSILLILGTKFYHHKKTGCRVLSIDSTTATLILSTILVFSYLLLLGTKVGPQYFKRASTLYALSIFYLLEVLFCIAYLCRNLRWIRIVLPFLIFITLFETNTKRSTFKDVQYETHLDLSTCLSIEQDMIQQVCLAEAKGQTQVEIIVPESPVEGNWPLATDCSRFFGIALHKHGVTRRLLETDFIPTPQEL